MKLMKENYEALYQELMQINEENYQGKFYVSSEEELTIQALAYLREKNLIEVNEENNDPYKVPLEISWKGEGLYCFIGIGFINEFSLAHIVELFELQTQVNYKIFFGDYNEIEKEKSNFKDSYVIWNLRLNNTLSIDTIFESEIASDASEILDEYNRSSHLLNPIMESIQDMDNETFYEFLKQYNQLLLN